MGIEDRNRVFPGKVHEEYNEDNLRDINERLVYLESILERSVKQWNAPTLVRGDINNDTIVGSAAVSDTTEHLFIQSGLMRVDHSDTWVSPYTIKALTFGVTFDEAPLVVAVIKGSTLNQLPLDIHAVNPTTSGFIISIRCAGDPTSGVCDISWLAIGKKVET